MPHPMGPNNPGSFEPVQRVTRKLMPPRPEWNLLGPYIPRRWREALTKINKRLVLQYFPSGGFWSVCLMMPRTKLLFKQAVLSLTNDKGKSQPPSWGMLHAIKRGMWAFRHQGMDYELNRLDQRFEAADQKRVGRQSDQLLAAIMRSLAKLDPTSRELGLSRVCVPEGGGYGHGSNSPLLAKGS